MRTLLIVDDNVELASLLAVVAEVHGFAPRIAHTGLAALEQMDKESPEAALVDLHLPDIAGQDLLKQLNARGVVTFAMSGVFKGEQFAKAAVETYGARAYFEKPFAARDAMVKMVGLVTSAKGGSAPPPDPKPLSARPLPRLPTVDALVAKAQAEIAAQAVARASPSAAPSLDDIPSVEELIEKQKKQAAPVSPAPPEASEPPAPPQASADSLDLDDDDEETTEVARLPPLEAMEPAETTGIFASGSAGSETQAEAQPASESAEDEAAQAREEPPQEAVPEACATPPATPPPSPADADEDEPAVSAAQEPAEAAPPSPAPKPEPIQPPPLPVRPPKPERRESWTPPPDSMRRQDLSLDTPLPLHPGTLAGLLSRFAARRLTGELRIKRGEVLKVIGLKDGHIVFAASNLSNERLPRWALRTGKLPANRVQELQSELKKGQRTCDALVSMGLVTQDERIKLVAGLVREIVWTLLDAEGGEAVFVTRAPPRKGLLPLALDPIAVVVRGYRQVFSLVRLRELADADKRFVHSQDTTWTPEELGLGPKESTLFEAADGSKTLDDLLVLSELEEREALVALVALTHLGLLELRAPPRRRIVLG